MSSQKGSCQCGRITFVVEGEPNGTTNCHCQMCQKASGAPYVTWAEFKANQVQWSGETLTWWSSSAQAERAFCSNCGTPLAFKYNEGQDIDVPSVLFEDPEAFPPQDETWTDSRRGWSILNQHLPKHSRGRS